MKNIFNTLRNLRIHWLRFVLSSWLRCVVIFISTSILFNLLGGLLYDENWLRLGSFLSLAVGALVSGTMTYGLYKEGYRKFPLIKK
ncbi:MAG: hypothetical protein JST20_00350 [Bacteroidetes bacterium]|nr:hypothetical protein [Bacteroidota bacterium]